MISGDEHFGFDPNGFVQRLVDETGVSHVWEPIATRLPEGTRMFISMDGSAPERNAKREAELVWMIWKRFSPSLDQLVSDSGKEEAAEIVATLFADFLIDDMDLVRSLEDAFRDPQHILSESVLSELERRAQRFPLA